jgi:aspartyl-tRNA(Asn)/glutamyl-tRNA(Gln) amidotransferase subunit A
MTAGSPHLLSVAEAARLIRERRLSPLELAEACLDRVSALDGQLNAFITVTAEQALAEARQAAEEVARGRWRGPLHGIPVALKDIFDTAGVRTTAGSRILEQRVPASDAWVVARLKAAGAVLLGKLNLHEFAFGATGKNPHCGPVRNPWNADLISGGSSSGSGAAVAAGQCLFSLGTDTGGSVRIPSALCGIVGLKPTFGRVGRSGVFPLSWSLDHVGPMTRTVEDSAIVLQAIAGKDPGDPSSSDEPVPDYTSSIRSGIDGLRVGVPGRFFFESLDSDVKEAVSLAVSVLEALGARVDEFQPPYADEIPAAVTAIMMPEALAVHHRWMRERPEDYGDDVRHRLELGALIQAVDYVHAQRLREASVRAWAEMVFGAFDVVVTPTCSIPAPPVDTSDLGTTLALVRLTNPINLLGAPAISVPCGFNAKGLPVGLQIIGRWFQEATLLRVAFAYEEATAWRTWHPPL